MADKQKTIEIIFGGVDNTGSAFKSVGSNLSTLERSVGSITGPIAGVTTSILKLDAVLAAAAAGLTAYGIKLSDDFGTAFAEISTLIGEPAANLGDFKNQIQSYAEQSTASLEEITNATYNAISAGVDYGQSLDVIAKAEELSIAGRADLGTTTKALVSTLNAYGAEMSEAADYSDIFFTIVQKGQTTLPELADNMGTVAPLAAQAGVSLTEVGAALATLTASAGLSTPEAMTALKGAISNIIKPSKEASDLAAQLGLDFSAAGLASKGLGDFMNEVALATGGNVEQMAALFPNVRALSAVLPLTGTGADYLTESLEAMADRQGKASKAAKELETDLSRLGQTLKNNVSSAFISFGDNLTDETAGIIESLTSIFSTIGTEIKLEDGAFSSIIGQFEGLFKDIESKFAAVAENLPEALAGVDFSYLVEAFDGLGDEMGDAFRALFGDIDLRTVEGLEQALQKIIDAFTALVNISTGIIDGLEPLFDLIDAGITNFKDLDEQTSAAIGRFGGLLTTIDVLLPVLGALGTAMAGIGTTVITLAGAKGIAGLTASLGGLTTIAAAAGKGGLIGAALFGAGAAGYGVGSVINEGVNKIVQTFSDSESLGTLLYDWINGDEVDKALGEMEVSLDTAKVAAEDFAQAQNDAAESAESLLDPVEKGAQSYLEQADAFLAANNAAGIYAEETGKLADAQAKTAGTLSIVKNEAEQFTEKAKEAAKATKEYQLKLLEIASDERIANIEANVKLNIAQLESDTKQAIAIIETLGTSIESTGNLIGSLFGNLENATGSKRYDIERQIDLENKARQDAFKLQERLTEAQIDLLRTKAQQIARGETLIKVSAEGLTPALEMIFNEVLEFAQVRANEQGLEFLTGV